MKYDLGVICHEDGHQYPCAISEISMRMSWEQNANMHKEKMRWSMTGGGPRPFSVSRRLGGRWRGLLGTGMWGCNANAAGFACRLQQEHRSATMTLLAARAQLRYHVLKS